MKTTTTLAIGLLAAAFALPEPLQAQSGEATYQPPQRGAPKRRVGGSSRGAEDALPSVMLLVPEHTGHTVSENPPLFWYLSKPTRVRVEVTLIDDKGETPLIEYSLDNAHGPAVHRIDLARHNVQLKPDVEYQWSISVVPNPNERSNDVMSGGAVKRVAVPPSVAAKRAQVKDKAELARLYAAEGIWYDAIALYSELIEQRPDDKALRLQRAALLEQVGLKEVAAFDRR